MFILHSNSLNYRKMEVSNTIRSPSLKLSCTENKTHVSNSSISLNLCLKKFSGEKLCLTTVKARKFPAVSCSGLTNSGHLEYFVKAKKKDKEKNSEIKEVKKKLKVFKRFSKDMAMVSDIAVTGTESENGLIGEVKGKLISEAMEILLKQLRQIKVEQKELKKKKKAELKLTMPKSKFEQDSSAQATIAVAAAASTTLQNEAVCCNLPQMSSINSFTNRKVEICMGGKCKKMGAMALLEEFEKKIGDEGVVVGCKCMGKCKSAPNVRLMNHLDGVQSEIGNEGSVNVESNPLFIGVSLEDVSEVVSAFLGKQSMHNCMVVAPA